MWYETMTNFELMNDLVLRLRDMESDLEYLRDTSEPLTADAIDKSLTMITELYVKLKDIDKALEYEKMGYVLF
jgi:hypothetical protein